MAETIAKLSIKKTATPDASPPLAFIEYGELALNYTTGKLFYRDSFDAIQTIGIKDPASLTLSQTFTGDPSFTGSVTFAAAAMTNLDLTDGEISWDANAGNIATVTLTQNSSLYEILNVNAGSYVLRIIQDGAGGHALTFGPAFMSPNGDVYEVASTANSVSIVTILNNGDANLYLVGQSDFVSFGTASPPLPT